jgi:hypothetical protein
MVIRSKCCTNLLHKVKERATRDVTRLGPLYSVDNEKIETETED